MMIKKDLIKYFESKNKIISTEYTWREILNSRLSNKISSDIILNSKINNLSTEHNYRRITMTSKYNTWRKIYFK